MHRLVEYQPSVLALPPTDLDFLLGMVRGSRRDEQPRVIESLTPTATAGEYLIRPGPFVGRFGLPSGASIDVASRFPFDDVVELISLSLRSPVLLDRRPTPGSGAAFLVDVVATAFEREVDRLVARGLAKAYRRQWFERPPYPGRLDVNMHLAKYAARPDRLVSSASRMTHDVPVNQALALCLDLLLRLGLPIGLSRSLAGLGPAFARIGRPPLSAAHVGRIELDRLTQRYLGALSLAELILSSRSLAPRAEALGGASLLFYMPRVWEGFVAHWATQRWGADYDVVAPHAFDLTVDGALSSEADVTVWQAGELVALYDAKYKWPGSTPDRGDVYQMVAYCQRLGIDEATLVYPGRVDEKSYRVNQVTVKTLGVEIERTLAAQLGSGSAPPREASHTRQSSS